MRKIDPASGEKAEKPLWRRPKVEELGNLRDFVRTGNAYGKSALAVDGNSMAGAETMP